MSIILKERIIEGLICRAHFSECERYRYALSWRWDYEKPLMTVAMLNPSTADHEKLDPTVTRCKKRAERMKLGGVRVINLFALRATNPKDMLADADPVGPDNDRVLVRVLEEARGEGQAIYAGWGKHGSYRDRDKAFMQLVARSPIEEVIAFDVNADGSPKHPLYIGNDVVPVTYWARS